MNEPSAKCKCEFDRQINKQVFCNERKRVAERLSSEWGAHTLSSHRQLDNDSRPALCESPPLGNKWCMKWRCPDSTGSTDRTLPALICGFWWVLAVTPGHTFHSAMGSQTASHSPNHQNPHTLFSRASLLSLEFVCKFLASQTLLRLGTPMACYSGDSSLLQWSAQYMTKSGDKSLEICEITATSVFEASDRRNCRCAGPWGHPNTIF